MTLGGGYKPRGDKGPRVQGSSSAGSEPRRGVVDQGWDDYRGPEPDELEYEGRRGRGMRNDMSREYGEEKSGGAGRFLRFAIFATVIAGLVLAGLNFVVRPLVVDGIVDWAAGNSTALQVPFVSDIVRGALWSNISTPADAKDGTGIVIIIGPGATPQSIAGQLSAAGAIQDQRAFIYESIALKADQNFQIGRHVVSKSMAMDKIIAALISKPVPPPPTRITFREGLRIEQMVAKLEVIEATPADPTAPLTLNVQQFYDLAMHPSQAFLSQYPWLKLPDGASLEGFLYPATYNVAPDTTPSQLLGMLVDGFVLNSPKALFKLPPEQIYKTVQIAALVEMEAKVDSDRPLIAGVYTNRLNPKIWPTALLNADPTLNYANDSVWLRADPDIKTWVEYSFWNSIKTTGTLSQVVFPDDLASYNTYHSHGLPIYPICSPSGPSIAAALTPDTSKGYLYFLAKNDGSGTHAFAKTQAEQDANAKLYGYTQ